MYVSKAVAQQDSFAVQAFGPVRINPTVRPACRLYTKFLLDVVDAKVVYF